jgi:hypothetical protein
MRHLVDRLTPLHMRCLRLLVTQDEELSQVAETLSGAGLAAEERVFFGVDSTSARRSGEAA